MNTTLRIHPDGTATALWSDLLPSLGLGRMTVKRASTIEFNERTQKWEVRFTGSRKVRFSHQKRSACIAWEHEELS